MDIVGLTAVVMVFGIPITAIITGHLKSMAQLRIEAAAKVAGSQSAHVDSEIAALRDEVARLRDTTTQYDIAFDTALQRLDSRVGHLEAQVSTSPRPAVEQPAANQSNTQL